ncbi:MAG: DinB family protein [Paucibacter sp.]|nr:DinB family protein [Roseateles sp.]
MSITTLRSLFSYKAWANAELFALLETLPASQAEQLHTCVRTLNHIYVVDRIFQAHLSGQPRPFDATNTKASPSLEQLRGDVAAADAWYVGYLAQLAEPALAESLAFTFTDGDAGRMTREEILLHIIAHGAYHRGNVGQVLKSISVAPPRDLFTKFLHVSEPARREVSSVER